MATLTVTATHNYSGETLDPNITDIVYSTSADSIATFGSNQFGPGLIADNVHFTGDAFVNTVAVNLAGAGSFSAAGWTFSGWNAADVVVLNGSFGADTITGSTQNDQIDGNQGADTAFMGAGNDTFIWDPGDGSDIVEGEAGIDTLRFNGSAAAEITAISANGTRALLTRNVGNIVMDLNGVETIQDNTLGGADAVTVNDLTGTSVSQVTIDLGVAGAGDAAADAVTVNGTSGLSGDVIQVAAVGSTVVVTGLAATITITNPEAANDRLTVNGNGGNDTISAGTLSALIQLTFDGGDGNDIINGGNGADTLIGGNGDDTIDGNQGNDVAFMGAGNDTFVWDPGDGSDIVEGQADTDTLRFNGSNANEIFAVSANGGRVLLTRDVGNIVMDIDDVERLELNAQAGFNQFTIGNLTGTDLTGEIVYTGLAGVDTVSAGSAINNMTVTGGTGNDSLTTGSGNDRFIWNVGDGTDTISAGAGTDTFQANGTSAGETFTLNPSGSNAVFTDGVVTLTLGAVEQLDLQAGDGTNLFAVGNLTGTPLIGMITYAGGTGVDIVSASAAINTMDVSGGDSTDSLTTGSGNDTITGGGGADIMNGGNGGDTFRYLAGADAAPGEQVNGQGGITDTIQLINTGSIDFTGVTISSVERLSFASGVSTASFTNAQITGFGLIIASSGDDGLVVAGASVNLASLNFSSWGTAGTDTIVINGTSGTDSLIGSGQADTIMGVGGNDTINGGAGVDVLAGGAGADRFIFDLAALTDAQAATPAFDRITDYDQGNSAAFNAVEGDQLDLSALLATAYNHGNGQLVSSLARAVASGTGANLQIDPDGAANGVNWVTIARLDGIHAGNVLNVILDPSLPAGSSITAGAAAAPNDFSGDFRSDVVWQNDNGQPAMWLMNGTTVASQGTVGGNPGPTWHIKDAGDFNGDGRSDILWQNDNGQPAMWLMNGTTVVSQGAVGGNPGSDWHIKAAADFNGDGHSDVLWQNDSGQAAMWLMKGTTVVSQGAVGGNPGADWHIKDAGDFDGDGHSDILWQNDSGQAAMWLMNGTTVVSQGAVGGNPGSDWHIKAAADFNRDGMADVLWQNDSGQPAMWLMNGTNVASQGAVGGNPGADWHIKDAGDFNGDGMADVLWQNDSGQPAMWLMNGTTVV